MNTIPTRLTGLALLGMLALALLLAPIHARADAGATDRHEIPTFVLERIELATGAVGRIG
ncbi:MAG TPA: hypothetical protein VLD36_15155 [Burkholderiales bacterium]|jgi:hypothetical protein|nr:hypothetical protein [Burkholderiales bacterium]